MRLTIELPDDQAAALKAQALEQGLSPDRIVSLALANSLPRQPQHENLQPFETGFGMWAKYGPSLSAEEIDANRIEMFRNFAQDL